MRREGTQEGDCHEIEKCLWVGLIAGVLAAWLPLAQTRYPFRDPALNLEKRIDNVLSLMMLDEKIAGMSPEG